MMIEFSGSTEGDEIKKEKKITSKLLPVPKNSGTNANQIMQVVYIVNPMNLDSLE